MTASVQVEIGLVFLILEFLVSSSTVYWLQLLARAAAAQGPQPPCCVSVFYADGRRWRLRSYFTQSETKTQNHVLPAKAHE